MPGGRPQFYYGLWLAAEIQFYYQLSLAADHISLAADHFLYHGICNHSANHHLAHQGRTTDQGLDAVISEKKDYLAAPHSADQHLAHLWCTPGQGLDDAKYRRLYKPKPNPILNSSIISLKSICAVRQDSGTLKFLLCPAELL